MTPPIVGQVSKVLHWYPTAVVGCYCQGPTTFALIILTGFGNWSKCGHCNRMYSITRIQPDGHTIDIDVMLAVEPEKVM
jgi:hypothetical protein